jgi:pimeloyl-ACP methyl ester carboxylesterase
MGTETVGFHNHAGDELSARLELPEAGAPRAAALFAHCFTCNKDYKAPVYIARELASHGIATLRFDFPGLGQSGGDFADTTLTGNVGDVIAAAEFLGERVAAPTILLGHSMGGAAVLQAAGRLPSVRLVCTLAATADPSIPRGPLSAAAKQAEQDGEALLAVAGRMHRIQRTFFDDLRSVDMKDTLARLDAALLVFHADVDLLVPPDNADRLFAAAGAPGARVVMPGAGHMFNGRNDCRLIAATVAAWSERLGNSPVR